MREVKVPSRIRSGRAKNVTIQLSNSIRLREIWALELHTNNSLAFQEAKMKKFAFLLIGTLALAACTQPQHFSSVESSTVDLKNFPPGSALLSDNGVRAFYLRRER